MATGLLLKEAQLGKTSTEDIATPKRIYANLERATYKSQEAIRPSNNGSQTTARRGELKYILNEDSYCKLREAIDPFVESDLYASSQICSLYLDTPTNLLIRRSIEKPVYKEKLRIRTYKVGSKLEDRCFLEIKKKSQGTVYKRRVEMSLQEAIDFCRTGKFPETSLSALSDADRRTALQILQEIAWCFSLYDGLRPSFQISCQRLSLKERGTDSLRITFDTNIKWTNIEVPVGISESYMPGVGQNALLPKGAYIMEVKASQAMPLWLVRILGEQEIYPGSFSKAGNAYRAWIKQSERVTA